MSSSRFDICLAETLKWEGFWSDDPHDPGGATMRGITIGVFAGARGEALTTSNADRLKRELRAISDDEVRAIYHRNYWLPLRAEEMPPGVDLAVFDFGVNSGITRSAKYIQRLVGARVDGHVGDATLRAIDEADPVDLVRRLMEDRRTFLRQIPTFWRFGKGWMNRCAGVESAALAMCEDAHGGVPVAAWSPAIVTVAEPVTPAPAKARVAETRATASSPGETAGGLIGSGSVATIGADVTMAAKASAAGGKDFSWGPMLLELLSRPSFWIAALALGGAVWMFVSERRRRWLLE